MPRIRMIRDTSETKATPAGKARTIKIPRGTEMEVSAASARWWVNKGDAMLIAGTGAVVPPRYDRTTSGAAHALPVAPPVPIERSTVERLTEIASFAKLGDWEDVYTGFQAIRSEEIGRLDISSDARLILSETLAEIQRTGGIQTISATDLNDALNEIVNPASEAPELPAAPEAPELPAAPSSARARGPRATTVSKRR